MQHNSWTDDKSASHTQKGQKMASSTRQPKSCQNIFRSDKTTSCPWIQNMSLKLKPFPMPSLFPIFSTKKKNALKPSPHWQTWPCSKRETPLDSQQRVPTSGGQKSTNLSHGGVWESSRRSASILIAHSSVPPATSRDCTGCLR